MVQKTTSLRAGWGRTVTAVDGSPMAGKVAASPTSFPYPRPRLAGYSPLVAATTSDARQPADALDPEHYVEGSYVGNPLATNLDYNTAFAIVDTGADADLFAGDSALALGMFGSQLTTNPVDLVGVGGTIRAWVTYPLGVFVAGLSAVGEDGILNPKAIVGHSNVAAVAAPVLSCNDEEILTGVIGTAFLSSFNTVIRVDAPQSVTIGGATRTSPDVHLQVQTVPLPNPAHKLSLEMASPIEPVLTASYYIFPFCVIFDPPCSDPSVPFSPTQLTQNPFDIKHPPPGGSYVTTLFMRQGEAGPSNPDQSMRMLFDSGAQVSAITPAAVIRLSLPVAPDFHVTLCGIGGTQEVDGYYIDYVRMSAQGGALEFSRAPFLVLSVPSPDGGPMDGILGTNFFWNRNMIIEPSLFGDGFLHLSDPIPFAPADFDGDMDVDLDDVAFFVDCMDGPGAAVLHPLCAHVDVDNSETVDLRDLSTLMRCFNGESLADPTCGD